MRPGQQITIDDVYAWIRGLGWWRILGTFALIACVVMTVIVCKRYQQRSAVWEHAELAPRTLPVVELTQEQEDALHIRVTRFKNLLIQEKPTDDLVLSADELNFLMSHMEGDAFSEYLYYGMSNGLLTASISRPLGDGRYLNGDAELSIYITGGRLCIFMEKVVAKGRPLSEAFMKEIRMENLAEFANRDVTRRRLFGSVESINVVGSNLVIRAKRRHELSASP